MASYNSTNYITYSLSGAQTPQEQTANYTVTDGEPDTLFETGDSFTYEGAGTLVYLGTMVVDGITWPVFGYVEFPDFVTVFMDQAPSVIPPVPNINSGDTYDTACFAAGTMIATPHGEVAVEDPKIGDRLVTLDGTETEVKWVGHQTVMPMFGTAKRNEPVMITAGALGENVPTRDLTVTADHGMVFEDVVVNASALVNGDSIRFVPPTELDTHFTVYHVETANHEAIIANGAAAETFIDYIGRQAFDNYQEYLDLYGDETVIQEMDHVRISSARQLSPEMRAWFAEQQVA